MPEIEVWHLSNTPYIDEEFNIEIENISDESFQIESDATVFFDDKSDKLIALSLTEGNLILPPFSPIKIGPLILNRKHIRYIEFKTIGKGKLKVKLKQKHVPITY